MPCFASLTAETGPFQGPTHVRLPHGLTAFLLSKRPVVICEIS